MLQKDAKLIFISSVNSSDQSTSFLYKLRDANERLLNVVSYVCASHKEEFDMHNIAVSCPCYRLNIPTYISMDANIKSTTNLILEGSFATELMGESPASAHNTIYKIVNDASIDHLSMCRIDTTDPVILSKLLGQIYVYIDPAYTNNAAASGTGIAIVCPFKHNPRRAVVLGIEHYFLKSLTGDAAVQIAYCACSLIKAVALIHPFIKTAFIAVEGNSSQDSAVAIATIINDSSSIPTKFLHTQDKTSHLQWPMYLLTNEKTQAFEHFIYAINTSSLSTSQVITSNTIQLTYDPVEYLIDQIKAIKATPLKDGTQTYSAKHNNSSDDVVVATAMAYFLATSNRHIFKELS